MKAEIMPTMTELLIAELRQEAATTRRVLERVPSGQLSWRPHAKSMSVGQLALHIAGLSQGIAMLLENLRTEVPVVPLPEAQSPRQALDLLEQSLAFASDRLAEWGDAGLAAEWTLTQDGHPIITTTRLDMVRTLMLNHAYHHRGQLTVYLRLLGVPLPPVYGPTADENPLG